MAVAEMADAAGRPGARVEDWPFEVEDLDAFWAKMRQAEEDLAAGRVTDARESLAKLRKKYGLD